MAVAIVAATSWPFFRDRAGRLALAVTLDQTRAAGEDPRLFSARLTPPQGGMVGAFAHLLGAGRSKRFASASALIERASTFSGDSATRANGTALFVGGEYAAAATAFQSIKHPDAHDWNDLAAAQFSTARVLDEQERLPAALAAADQALALAPELPEATFNRAAIIDALGLKPAARLLWRDATRHEPSSRWDGVIRSRLSQQTEVDTEKWKRGTQAIDELTDSELSQLARTLPELARKWAEGPFLSDWAEAQLKGDLNVAQRRIRRARIIGKTLQQATGESLLADVVATIDHANPARLKELVQGHLDYREGRLAYSRHMNQEAERSLRRAQGTFQRASSAMATVSTFFIACTIYFQERPNDALDQLRGLVASERAKGGHHKALIAQALYQIALCEAVQGHWSASLSTAEEAQAIYTSLGERGNAATATAVLSENYDFLGNAELAWKYGVTALQGSCIAGDLPRARTILAALCRTEIRGARWKNARALIRLEKDFAPFAADVRYDTDLFRRQAIVEWQVGATIEAGRSIDAARSAARRIANEEMRARLLADIDGAAGTLLRRSNSRVAVALLTSAIEFQQTATRPILLPELYLERGRAHLSIRNAAAAERDFEAGIRELERQRRGTYDADLRAGIFGDSSELFDEAISVQLHAGQPAAVLSYVERGRARSILEEMEAAGDRAVADTATVANIQQNLAPRSVLIEYVSLPQSLCILLIARDRVVLRNVAVDRSNLALAAEHFAESVAVDDAADSRALSRALLEPIASDLRHAESLNIVADEILEHVPFAALRESPSGAYLAETHVLTTAPSAAVWITARKRAVQQHTSKFESAILFGNPAMPERFQSLANLDNAEEESVALGRRYRRAYVLVRREATVERFLNEAPLYDVVHFAGHAVVQPREPGMSAMLLASSGNLDGALTLRQISNMKFRSTRLVVLAACGTLRGRNTGVEGVLSLARGFLIAGIPAVVGTLWDIDDADAAPFMRAFHKRVARGESPASALHAAQVEAIRAHEKPSIWAGFALAGFGDSN